MAVKGNTYRVGKYIYRTAEELQKKVDEYFKSCEGEIFKDKNGEYVFDKFGKPVWINKKPPTVTGLALYLGFGGRQALLNYQNRDEFKDTIIIAKSRIEEYVEGRLFDKDGVTGAKFSLVNNFKGWKESPKQEEEKPVININFTKASETDAKDD